MFGLKGILGFHRVRRNPDDLSPGLREGGSQCAKFEGFLGATGGVCLGVKIQDQLLAAKVAERDMAPTVAGYGKIRRYRGRRECGRLVPSFRRFRGVSLHKAEYIGAGAGGSI